MTRFWGVLTDFSDRIVMSRFHNILKSLLYRGIHTKHGVSLNYRQLLNLVSLATGNNQLNQENPFIDEMSTGLFALPGLPSVGFEDSFDPDDEYDRDSR